MPDTVGLIAITGSVTLVPGAAEAAEALGRELARAGFHILVYSSGANFAEAPVVRGYVASQKAQPRSIQVRYPLHGTKPEFPEQTGHGSLFDWRPDHSPDWEISFYRSLSEVQGTLLIGGGSSTLIAGLVSMGYNTALLPIPTFGGGATKVWEALRPEKDLVSADEIAVMARPAWSDDQAGDCVAALTSQLARKADRERLRRVEELRRETSIAVNACFAIGLFLLAMCSIAVLWAWGDSIPTISILLLFVVPLLAGVSGSTIRLIFDWRSDTVPLSRQSALTTGALGLIAGGIAGLLFITAQVTTASVPGRIVTPDQARKLSLFCLLIGFTAGLTLDAVFRKLIASDVLDLSSIDKSKSPK